MSANILDRLVGLINPGAGLRRVRERQMLQRAYEGARQTDGWRPRRAGASANTDHMADAGSLRARSRALVQNVPYIARGLESLVANTIGTGITPRSLAANAGVIDALWAEWVRVADADGRLNLYGLQAAAYRAMEQDGEVLIRLRTRRPEDGLPVPLQLQLLEIDWLDSAKNGTVGGNVIVNGIEYSPLGKRVAYWLWDQHPGELQVAGRRRSSSYPVPADRIIHLYAPQRPGQGRGFPRLAPVIARVRDLQLYEDAELQRKNLETRLSVVATGNVESMSLSESKDPSEVRATGELGSLASGGITGIPAGMDLTVVEPKAAPGYVDYLKFNLHLVAAGMGVTYEMLTGDVRDTNFSSARVALLEFRRSAEQMQWLHLIPGMGEPIWRAFIDAAVLGGRISRPDYGCDWSTPKWEYVNPKDDVQAELAEIAGGLSSWSEVLRRRGYKPELVFAELKRDMERLRADGTLDVLLMMLAKQAPPPAAAPAGEPSGSRVRGWDDELAAHYARLGEQQLDVSRAVREAMETLAASRGSAAAPAVNVALHTNEIEAGLNRAVDRIADAAAEHIRAIGDAMPIQVTVPQPEVRVEVRNEVPAPVVHVDNHVQPAQVAVDVRATMPARITETVPERNARGEIVRTVTTERDA